MLSPAGPERPDLVELVNRYALFVDWGAYEAVGELFLADGVLLTPDPPHELRPVREISGRSAIVAELQRLEDFGLTYHGLVGHVFESLGPDRARGRVKCVAHHVRGAGRTAQDLVWHLDYDDHYVRREDHWLIARRAITIDLIDMLPVRRANSRRTSARTSPILSTGAPPAPTTEGIHD